jgi:signal transduction histidine kinase
MLALNACERDLVPIVNEVSHFMSSAFESRSHDFSVEIPDHDIIVKIDEKRIRQVLINLLDNAYKFTPKNGKVTLRLYTRANSAIVEIKDTGLGIPEEKKRGLFTPYANLGSGSNNGMGLGLSLCKMLIDLHGGKIWHSNLERGSIFGFSIPIFREPA